MHSVEGIRRGVAFGLVAWRLVFGAQKTSLFMEDDRSSPPPPPPPAPAHQLPSPAGEALCRRYRDGGDIFSTLPNFSKP
jgi:hypothetical protein